MKTIGFPFFRALLKPYFLIFSAAFLFFYIICFWDFEEEMGPEKWTANFVAPINFSILILTCPDVSPKGWSHMIELIDLKLS